jgi:type IV fimbrial biogenesis protein FimT
MEAIRSTRSLSRGVTLIEACIVFAIAAILIGTATPSFVKGKHKRLADGVAGELATDLRFVRSVAVARNEGVRMSFYASAAGQCYLFHTGARGDCSCDSAGAGQCSGGAEVLKSVFRPADQHVKVVANVSSMLFNADNGTTVPGGTVCVVPSSGRDMRHTVNIMGRVKTCSAEAGRTPCGACQ